MDFSAVEALGRSLAFNRRHGSISDLPLGQIGSFEEATAVQAEAVEAFQGSVNGYAMAGTSALTRRILGSSEPIYGPLLDSDLLPNGAVLSLPRGVIGAGCGLSFVIGRPYPAKGEPILEATIADAIAACHLTIGVLGRRVPGSVPLNALTATADFALSVAHLRGPAVPNWNDVDLAAVAVRARINEQVVATGETGSTMGHPFAAVAWLARALATRNRQLSLGDTVITSSCVGILQVLPGQIFEADFGSLGKAGMRFA